MVFWAFGASAEIKTFQFVNPSFGGNPLYTTHLFTLASKQYVPPVVERETKSEIEDFADQIKRRTLSSLSSVLSTNIRQLSLDDLDQSGSINLDTMLIDYRSIADETTGCTNVMLELTALDTGENILLDIPDFSCQFQ